MTIGDLKTKVDLLKVANNRKYCLIPELCRELKVSKSELMQFILDNPKLIYSEPVWSYKEKKIKRQLWPNDRKTTYTDTIQQKNKNLGVGIYSVYLDAKDNYRTEEWLIDKIITSQKALHITEWSNYGYIKGYFVQPDAQSDSDKYRMHVWRNTPAKLQWLKDNGYFHKQTFFTGGFGDCSSNTIETAISLDKINELKELGWSINELPPLSK